MAEKELPNLESTETVEIVFKFPKTTVTILNATKGRARLTCNALCKKFKWKQE